MSADGGWAYKNCTPSWHNLNARINWEEPLGYEPLQVSLSVNNVTGFSGPVGVGSSYNSSGYSTFYPTTPRNIYLSLRHSF
ncbi:TonB-dependent receptor [Sphingobium sp.]|uniref:TonB-dependent receptor n=1 Tax=Sphingobium sp. TaxID=1912891 RepID=UPI00260887B9|nr:TonB-dependent receptor [Sphingobium sp.]